MEEQYHSEDESLVQNAQNPQKKDQRVLVGLFVVLFASISIIGIQGITRSIQYPFIRKDGSKPIALSELSTGGNQEQIDESLKKMDTDKDGLNDYDEISIYGTSAFLDDSDGDGYGDKTEVLTGHDPLCNEAMQVCGPSQGQIADMITSTSTDTIPKLKKGILGADGKPTGELPFQLSQNMGSSVSGLPAVNIPGFDKPMTVQDLRNLSPQEIRDFLIRQGGSEKDLKNIDDVTLKKVYAEGFESAYMKVANEQEQEALKSPNNMPTLPQISEITSESSVQQEPFNPETMTAEQLRDLLRKTGKISEADLQRIDDTTLKALATQALSEVKK